MNMVLKQLHVSPCSLVLRVLLWLLTLRVLFDFNEILTSFWPFEHRFLDLRLRFFQCSDLVETGVYGNQALSTFQWN